MSTPSGLLRSHRSGSLTSTHAQALTFLLDLHTISHTITMPSADPDNLLSELKLTPSDELQARCAGYVEAEIERYAESLREAEEEEQDPTQREAASDDDASSGSETETERSQGRSQRAKGKGKKKAPAKKGKGKQAAPKKAEKRRRKTAAQIRGESSPARVSGP